jgi:hypothetical protein
VINRNANASHLHPRRRAAQHLGSVMPHTVILAMSISPMLEAEGMSNRTLGPVLEGLNEHQTTKHASTLGGQQT